MSVVMAQRGVAVQLRFTNDTGRDVNVRGTLTNTDRGTSRAFPLRTIAAGERSTYTVPGPLLGAQEGDTIEGKVEGDVEETASMTYTARGKGRARVYLGLADPLGLAPFIEVLELGLFTMQEVERE